MREIAVTGSRSRGVRICGRYLNRCRRMRCRFRRCISRSLTRIFLRVRFDGAISSDAGVISREVPLMRETRNLIAANDTRSVKKL